MICGHTSELAIRAALYLALQGPGKLSPVHEVAKGTGLPAPYLSKIVRRLIRAGLVRAFRGPGGGLELGRAADTITLWAVVTATEGLTKPDACVFGLRSCSAENPCPLHTQWKPLRDTMERLLKETTLASLARGLREAQERGAESWVKTSAETARPHVDSERKVLV